MPPRPASLLRKLAFAAAAVVVRASAEGAPPPADRVDRTTAPDPEPLTSARELVLDLTWERGTPVLSRAALRAVAPPRKTGRWMGRFAIELLEGPALIERLRFNFPLMHDAPPVRAHYKNPPDFEGGLTTTIRVVFPAVDRGSRFELVDRATGRRWGLPWPIESDLARTALISLAPTKAKTP